MASTPASVCSHGNIRNSFPPAVIGVTLQRAVCSSHGEPHPLVKVGLPRLALTCIALGVVDTCKLSMASSDEAIATQSCG